jgi:hypothetical protein
MTGLGFEAGEFSLPHLRKCNLLACPDLIGKVRVDDRLTALLDVLNQVTQPEPDEFQKWHGDTFPPLLRLDRLDQFRTGGDSWDSDLVLERRRSLDQLFSQRLEPL